MNIVQAREFVGEVFKSSFDRNRYKKFIRNILNSYDEVSVLYKDELPSQFRPYIKSIEKIGSYKSASDSLDVLIVQMNKECSVAGARVAQRNAIAWYLSVCIGNTKDAALVAFVSDDNVDWRFSFIQVELGFQKNKHGEMKAGTLPSPARRWSFLVGPNEKTHTAQSRFLPLLTKDDISPSLMVIREAFNIEKVTKEFYEKYKELYYGTYESINIALDESDAIKGEFTRRQIKAEDFAKKLLGQIVFLYFLQKKGWFGVERDKNWGTGSKSFLRELYEGKHLPYNNFFNDILEPLFYEALSTERQESYYSKFNCRIPFLNGGLFDPIGGYDWVNTDICLPNTLFVNTNKTTEGDVGDGILDIFDRYNFTVNEEESLDKEVAVDPEMLGKVFENLLEIRDRKSSGAFYTPREIVHYMCQECIIRYLQNRTEGQINQILLRAFMESNETFNLIETISISEAKIIDNALEKIRICDPAIGSGAFPVGMMMGITKIRLALSEYLGQKKSTYEIKRNYIENSLYGVDIDSGAIEIAKLRLWLSLVVEEEDFENIEPLPNLDYKVMTGDSLLGEACKPQGTRQIEMLKTAYFSETNQDKKMALRKNIELEINSLINSINKYSKQSINFSFWVDFSEVFSQNDGFDIVISNPPYIQLQKLRNNPSQVAYKMQNFNVYDSMGDVYCLFFERGIQLLKKGGLLCYITSNKWMRTDYGKKLRMYLANYNPLILLDLGSGVFDTATVDTDILLVEEANSKGIGPLALSLTGKTANDVNVPRLVNSEGIQLPVFGENPIFIGGKNEIDLKSKIEKAGIPLGMHKIRINYGIKTGLNNAFIIDTRTKELLCSKDPNSQKLLKPVLKGRDIEKYKYSWDGLWLINTGYNLDIPTEYPVVFEHLKQFEEKARKRKDQGLNWYNLRSCAYYDDFSKEKIMWKEMSSDSSFIYDVYGYYCIDTARILVGEHVKFLTALFNSKLFRFSFAKWYSGGGLGDTGIRFKGEYMKNFPVPECKEDNQAIIKTIEGLVENIAAVDVKSQESILFDISDKIDILLYELYGLNRLEVASIEAELNYPCQS